MLTIHLTRRSDSSVTLRLTCPDSQIFQNCISTLKFEIAPRFRSYDPLTKCWIILAEAAVELENYIQRMVARFCAAVVVEEEANPAREEYKEQGTKSSSEKEHGSPFERRYRMTFQRACATLFVTPGAPFEVIQGAYRALAKMHHPDLGGDTHVMRQINDAYETLTAELRKRKAAA